MKFRIPYFVKYILCSDSKLIVLHVSNKQVKRLVYFEGSPRQLMSEMTVTSYRLRSWLYQYADIHSSELIWLHDFLLNFRPLLVNHLRLFIQINLSTVLLNSLPVLYLDGGQALPLLLKAVFPRWFSSISMIISCVSSAVVLVISIVGLWPYILSMWNSP